MIDKIMVKRQRDSAWGGFRRRILKPQLYIVANTVLLARAALRCSRKSSSVVQRDDFQSALSICEKYSAGKPFHPLRIWTRCPTG
jgi:hypothetical protein